MLNELLEEYQRLLKAKAKEEAHSEYVNEQVSKGGATRLVNVSQYSGEHVSIAKIERTGKMLREQMIKHEKGL